MEKDEIWEKRKFYNGCDCYILERKFEESPSPTTETNPKNVSKLDPNRKIVKFVEDTKVRGNIRGKTDIILVQNNEMLGFVEVCMRDDKTACLTAVDPFLSRNLPLEIEQYRGMIADIGTAIFVDPEKRRERNWYAIINCNISIFIREKCRIPRC